MLLLPILYYTANSRVRQRTTHTLCVQHSWHLLRNTYIHSLTLTYTYDVSNHVTQTHSDTHTVTHTYSDIQTLTHSPTRDTSHGTHTHTHTYTHTRPTHIARHAPHLRHISHTHTYRRTTLIARHTASSRHTRVKKYTNNESFSRYYSSNEESKHSKDVELRAQLYV